MTTVKVVVVMFLWAACFPLITAGLELAPHLSFATMRAAIAGGTLVMLGVASGCVWPTGWSTWLLLGVAGVGATTLGFFGMFHAAEFVAPGTATVIANTQPLLAAGLGHFVLKERTGPLGALGLGLGFVGIVVIAAPGLASQGGGDEYLRGIAYIILAAAGITVSNVVFKRLAGSVDPLIAMGSQLLLGAIPLAAISMLTESPTNITWSATFVLSLLGLALPGTALVFWLWLTVLESTTLNRANAFSFLVPIFGFAMGIAFYGEALSAPIAAGMAITVLGIAVVTRTRPPTAARGLQPGVCATDGPRLSRLAGRADGGPSSGESATAGQSRPPACG